METTTGGIKRPPIKTPELMKATLYRIQSDTPGLFGHVLLIPEMRVAVIQPEDGTIRVVRGTRETVIPGKHIDCQKELDIDYSNASDIDDCAKLLLKIEIFTNAQISHLESPPEKARPAEKLKRAIK